VWESGVLLDKPEAKPGVEYLKRRGITPEIAALAEVHFCKRWNGGASVVFPIYDQSGELVAAQGRHIAGSGKRTAGVLRRGVFSAPAQINERVFAPFDEAAPAIIICEAPIDALSIACAGFPAIALCGVARPEWLHRVCAFRRILLAFDADATGDGAAQKLMTELSSYGAQCERLRPEGAKDWNEFLCAAGAHMLAEWLVEQVLL
jgi:DNA primase